MKIRKYTKCEIVLHVLERRCLPEVKTQEAVSETFDVLREMMSEDKEITRIELRNLG